VLKHTACCAPFSLLQLEQCLDAPKPDIPAVSEPLRAIAEQVEHEMDNSVVSQQGRAGLWSG